MKKLSVKVLVLFIVSMFMSVPVQVKAASYNYAEALQKSILFYEAQRSGSISTSEIPTRLTWRGDSQLTDGQKEGLDLTGGWVDAGDNIKFNITAGYTATTLAVGAIEYREAYEKSGQMKWLLNQLRWINDFFIKCHPSPNVFWAQVGMTAIDHNNWVPIEVSHITNDRSAIKIDERNPGTEVAMDVAAAMAASSILFRSTDPAYADTLLTHAEQLYKFGDTNKGKFSDTIAKTDPQGAAAYTSHSGYDDELVWGSIWLYKGKEAKTPGSGSAYLEKAKTYYNNLGNEGIQPVKKYKWTHCWDDKAYGSYVYMSKILPDDPKYKEDVERWLNWWTVGGTEHGADGTKASYTPGGHARIDRWGSLRYVSTTALFAFIYSDSANDSAKKTRYYDFAKNQINYILGDNPRKASYIVGFGENYPQHPHHRTAHGCWSSKITIPEDHRHILYGALVGSPTEKDGFNDSIEDYEANEVAIDYNAGVTGALARMYKDFGGTPIPDSQFPLPDKPYEPKDEWPVFAGTYYDGGNATQFTLTVENRSAWPAKPINNLKVRYFFTLEADDPSDIYYEPPKGAKITGPTVWDAAKKIYYITLDFSGEWIYPGYGWEVAGPEVNFTIGSSSNNWDSSNDWSFQDWDSKYVNGTREYAPNMPMYEGDVKLAGNEPSGGTTVTPPPVTTPPVTTTPPSTPSGTLGDLNGDGDVNSTDYAVLKRYLLGILPDIEPDMSIWDINKDGLLNSTDYAVLKRYLLGLYSL
jgi:hypothetical protein